MPAIAAIYSVACIDPRDRIVEGAYAKLLFLMDALNKGLIEGKAATILQQQLESKGSTQINRLVSPFRNARAGGGWSQDAPADLQTIKSNGLPLVAIFSVRHKECAALRVGSHLHDQDVAVMIVTDLERVGLARPPVFRAHLEINVKVEEFDPEPMNIPALVAYAAVFGVGPLFPTGYSVETALAILGMADWSDAQLRQLAGQVHMSSKGLIEPAIALDEPVALH